jgi:hypothetical protein
VAEIRDDSDAAMAELLVLADETVLGFDPVTIGGVETPAVITDISTDEIIAAGGLGEAGGFTATVALDSFPDGPPEKYTAISARGMNLHILNVSRGTSHYVITAGDPVELQS